MKQPCLLNAMLTPVAPTKQLIRNQRGVALPTVLIFLLLSIISVLGAFRAGFLNEKVVGNESDYNRAFAAAEALIRDAEMDIRGRRPPYDVVQADGYLGFPCRPTTDGSTTEITSKAGYENSCRPRNGLTPWFPKDNDEFDQVFDLVAASPNRCKDGICFPLNMDDLKPIETQLFNGLNANSDVLPIGTPYGAFTRTVDTTTANLTKEQSNPLLVTDNVAITGSSISRKSNKAWYVVEAFRYGEAVSSGEHPATAMRPDPARRITYRITAVSLGMKPGTRVVLKSTFVPFPANQSP